MKKKTTKAAPKRGVVSAIGCSVRKYPYATKAGAKGHVWKLTESGEIDIFGYNPSDPHNGPVCVNCGYGFCHHCHDLPLAKCSAKPNPSRQPPAPLRG